MDKIILTDDRGEEVEFELVCTFGVNDEEYAALFNEIDEEIYLMRLEEYSGGEFTFTTIDDKDEFDDVVEAYEEFIEEE